MGVLTFLSYSSASADTKSTVINEKQQTSSPPSQEVSQLQMTPPTDTSSNTSSEDASQLSPPSPEHVHLPPAITSEQKEAAAKLKRPTDARRFSFRSFSFVNLNEQEEHKPALSTIQDHEKKAQASAAFTRRLARPMSTTSDRRAKESALIVRSLIIGPTVSAATPQTTRAVAKPQLSKVKSQLMQPKSANKVIAQLRSLPATDALSGKDGKKDVVTPASKGPIHAVCLAYTDAEEHELHFAQLIKSPTAEALEVSGIAAVSIETLTSLFKEMHIVNLMTAPNFGLGEPGDGAGILAGAVPTAETIIDGIQEITPQLMALGYATGKAVLPDHTGSFIRFIVAKSLLTVVLVTGVHPPTDRMSVLTCAYDHNNFFWHPLTLLQTGGVLSSFFLHLR